jgi:hypothetical protein
MNIATRMCQLFLSLLIVIFALKAPNLKTLQQYMMMLICFIRRFFTILILLYVCNSSKVLQPILRSAQLKQAIDHSIGPLLNWLRDMQVVHPVAAWCWQLIKVLYKDHPMVSE